VFILLISDLTAGLVARLVDAVQVNRSHRVLIDGHSFWFKQRRLGRSLIIILGNIFLKYSNSKIIMFTRTRDWQKWEVESYRLLYGNRNEIMMVGRDAVQIPNIAGVSLKEYLESHILTLEMVRAAAIEFSRVHHLATPMLGSEWSHGDPHLENVLYDTESHQAHLIDFETCHQQSLSVDERRADDLLVFLLDLLGRDNSNSWLELSSAFLETYANRPVLERLSIRLIIPNGLEAVLWKTRTNFMNRNILSQRLALLRECIQEIVVVGISVQ
jgi:hypothetical protein